MVGTDWEPTASFTLIGCCAHYWRGKLWKVCLPELFVLQHHNRTREGGGKEEEERERESKGTLNESKPFIHSSMGLCLSSLFFAFGHNQGSSFVCDVQVR